MNGAIQLLGETLLLVTALSLDAFAACVGYGASRISIPPLSALLLSGVGSLLLAFSLLMGGVVRGWLPPETAHLICVVLLGGLGLVKLFDSSIKRAIRRRGAERELRFSALHLRFILRVYADPEEADRDQSRVLTPAEATSLAVALSLDSLAVGFGAALEQSPVLLAAGLCFLMGLLAVHMGCWVGRQLAKRTDLDLSWLSGALLLLLALH